MCALLPSNNVKKTPLGVSYPIQRGESTFFEQTFDTNQLVKSNLKLLFSTIPGERRFNPDYGTKLWRYIFENIDEYSNDIIRDIISSDIARWIPEIVISSIDVAMKDGNPDTYTVIITLNFYSSKYSTELQRLNFENEILKIK